MSYRYVYTNVRALKYYNTVWLSSPSNFSDYNALTGLAFFVGPYWDSVAVGNIRVNY